MRTRGQRSDSMCCSGQAKTALTKQSTRLGSVAHGVRCFNVHHANIRWNESISYQIEPEGGNVVRESGFNLVRLTAGDGVSVWSQRHQTPAWQRGKLVWWCSLGMFLLHKKGLVVCFLSFLSSRFSSLRCFRWRYSSL